MLGLVGAVGGAVALEIRRIRHRGSVEEGQEAKAKTQQLLKQLEPTNRELERVREHNEAAQERASQLEQQNADLSKQREQLQQNNSKLVLTNVMLLNKAKHLEDSSRALVAKQEDLQHQLEQLQREHQAEQAAAEAAMAALKDQVSAVLNRYLSKDTDLQQALAEMQAMGIELVPIDSLADRPANVMEFETKLVLESPHRMQRLMTAAAGRMLQLPGSSEQDAPMLAFPLGVGTDPATGLPRISLGWRQEPQFSSGPTLASLTSASDAEQHAQDQRPPRSSAAPAALTADTASADTGKAAASSTSSSIKAATVTTDSRGGEALTFSAAPAQKQKSSGGFSLGFGRIGGSKASSGKTAAVPSKPVIVPSTSLLKAGMDDDLPQAGGNNRALSTI